MDMAITAEVLARFNDKDSKKPEYRSLYESHDFMTAYAQHTDARMALDPHWAIGRGDEWESHGLQQVHFLRAQGMRPGHRLLDIGCGPGRAARRIVPYLEPGHYVGADISPACLAYAQELAVKEGWAERQPVFIRNGDLDLLPIGSEPEGWQRFDYLWAHSVFTHLPDQQINTMIGNAARLLPVGGQFLFSYKEATVPRRSGLKQFQYPPAFFADLARQHRFDCKVLDYVWPAHQRTIRLTKSP